MQGSNGTSAEAALRKNVSLCQSAIERMFYLAAYRSIPGLTPQYRIGKYSADFAIPWCKVVIEADGYAYHHTKHQMIQDTRRQRNLMKAGWIVIRFTGTEIKHGVGLCVSEVIQIVKAIKQNGA